MKKYLIVLKINGMSYIAGTVFGDDYKMQFIGNNKILEITRGSDLVYNKIVYKDIEVETNPLKETIVIDGKIIKNKVIITISE